MRHNKVLAWFALAAGLALPGAASLKAQDRYWDGRDERHDYRDIRRDSARVDGLRADIARDRWRLDRHIRAGMEWAAAEDARDLARDQQALRAQIGDIRRDRADMYYDRRER